VRMFEGKGCGEKKKKKGLFLSQSFLGGERGKFKPLLTIRNTGEKGLLREGKIIGKLRSLYNIRTKERKRDKSLRGEKGGGALVNLSSTGKGGGK